MSASVMISKPDGNDEYHHSDIGLDLVKYYAGRTPVGSFGAAGTIAKTVSTSSTTDGWTSLAYDALGRKNLQCNPDNGTPAGNCTPGASYQEWNYLGAATRHYDERRNLWQFSTDALGRVIYVAEPTGQGTRYSYSARGDLANAVQVGLPGESPRTRSFTYDFLSRLVLALNPETGAICYGIWNGSSCQSGYDPNGNLLAKTDARGTTTSYSYDALNRLTRKTYSNGDRNQWFAYDGQDESGNSLGYPWTTNSIGRLSHTSDSVAVASTYEYDQMGRVLIKGDCVPSNCSPGVLELAHYDLAGKLTSLTYPSGRQLGLGYDGAGRLMSINETGSNTNTVYLQSATYHADGTPANITYGNGVSETVTQNGRLQTCETSVTKGTQTFLDRQYFFGTNNTTGQQCSPVAGNNGNVWSIGDAVDGTHSQSFSYDSLNRVRTWDAPNIENGVRHLNFTYDSFGNMVSDRGYGPSPGTIQAATGTPSARAFPNVSYDLSQWPYNGQNQRVSATFDCTPTTGSTPYDQAGNLLCDGSATDWTAKQYAWDAESRIARVSAQPGSGTTYYPAAAYTYDAEGQRVRSDLYSPDSTGNGWREYNYFNGMMLADKDQNGNWTDYIYANGKKIARVQTTQTGTPTPVTTTVSGLHIHGNEAVAGTPVGASWLLDLGSLDTPDVNLENHTVQSGDQIAWRQYQSASMTGGFGLYFWDCGGTGQLLDTNGVDVYASPVHNAWETRALSLEPYVGCRFQTFAVKSWTIGTPGSWDFWMTDVVLRHADGTSLPVYTPSNAPAPTFQGADSGETDDSAMLDSMTITTGTGTGTATSPGTTLTYTITDHLGTAALEFSDTGALIWEGSFAPFGQEIDSNQTTNRFKFTGKERDTESGLDYFGARYYGSNMGRFMSPDWAAKAQPVPYAKLSDPQTLNLYSYVGNNPLSRTDPTGHYVISCATGSKNCDQKELDRDNAAIKAAQGSKNQGVASAAKAYGALGEKNGVVITVKDVVDPKNANVTGQTGAQAGTPGFTFNSTGPQAGTATGVATAVSLQAGLSSDQLNDTVQHEGQHVADRLNYVNALIADPTGANIRGLTITGRMSEVNAYTVGGRSPEQIQQILSQPPYGNDPGIDLPLFGLPTAYPK